MYLSQLWFHAIGFEQVSIFFVDMTNFWIVQMFMYMTICDFVLFFGNFDLG